MAAVATKKIGADLDQQLSFPTMFEEAYAELRLPTKYFPSQPFSEADLPAGDDLQARWHEQKRLDAHKSVMNGVRDTRRAEARAFSSHAGYFGIPKPVLGQRIFANPSLGSGQADIYSARRTAPASDEAPFHCAPLSQSESAITPSADGRGGVGGGLSGGVLRSKQGQEYGKKLMADRLRQLNAIDVAKAEQMMGQPMGTIQEPPFGAAPGLVEVESPELIKLAGLMTNLQNAVSAYGTGVSKLDISDYTELVSLIVRLAPKMSREVLEDLMAQLDEVSLALDGYEEDEEDSSVLLNYLRDGVPKLRDYVRGMLRGVNQPSIEVMDEPGMTEASLVPSTETMSAKEKEALSRNLVRSLGLTKKPAEKLPQRKTIGPPGPEVAALAREQAAPRAPVAAPIDVGAMNLTQLKAEAKRLGLVGVDKYKAKILDGPTSINALRERVRAAQAARPGGAAAEPAGANVRGRGRAPRALESRAPPRPSAEGVIALSLCESGARMTDTFTRNAETREDTEAAEAATNAGIYKIGTRFDVSGPQKFAAQGSLGYYGEVNPKFTGITLNEARVGKPDDAMAMVAAKTREAAAPVGLESVAVGKGRRRQRKTIAEGAAVEGLRARKGTKATSGRGRKKEADGLDDIKAEIAQRVAKKGGKKAAPKKWIQEAVKGMKKGAFTKQALAHDETPKEYAENVLAPPRPSAEGVIALSLCESRAHPKKHTVKTRRRAQFIKNIMKE